MKLQAVSLLLGLMLPVFGADWQWSTKEGNGRAFLWIPPNCEKVRGVVVAQHNMLEESVLEHPVFRKELAALGIAEMWIVPHAGSGPNIEEGAGGRILDLLRQFGSESGYKELAEAPVVPLGHSACATVPWNFAATHPERTLAVLSVHGDAPQTRLTGNGKPRMEWDGHRIDGIPGLFTIAEFEWMEERILPGLEFRKKFPGSCIAMLSEPAQGHFAATDELVGFLGMFVRKSATARLSPDGSLKKLDPSRGWLVQRGRLRQHRTIPTAPVQEYTGDAGDAFWAFDREMAHAIQSYQEEQIGKRPQLLGFVQEGAIVPQVDRHEQVNLEFLPENDGVTFTLLPAFLSEVEKGSANLPRWTGLPVGSPLGHSRSATVIRRITGPFVELGKNRFEMRLNRTWSTVDKRNNQLWFVAENPGDAEYSGAVQQAMMTLPPVTGRKPQTIEFPQPQDVGSGTRAITLKAHSDGGREVRFYVREGPAEIEGNTLRFTPIPPRSRYPITVTVVAWQWGGPVLDAAATVERTFSIVR